jgi:hypothetical protein
MTFIREKLRIGWNSRLIPMLGTSRAGEKGKSR